MKKFSSSILALIARCSRWLQSCFPNRPIKGLTRFANAVTSLSYPYIGPVKLQRGIQFYVDSRQSSERWLLFSGDYQPALTNILQKYVPEGGTCLDIGANLGFYTVSMARWVGQSGDVIAFEANPDLVQKIKRNVALNHFEWVDVVGAAVHCEGGCVEFHLSSSPGKSSIYPVKSMVRKIVVPAVTIDCYSEEQQLTRLDAIKMDIEGNDCQALIGARKTLQRFRPFITFEYKSITPVPIAQEAFALLTSMNYQLWALTLDGDKTPFDLGTNGSKHTDVICVPAHP